MTDILTGIFSRILNTSVAACFLIGAVFLLRFVFRKVAPKTIICFLWGIVALRLVLPFSIQSPIGLVPEKASTVASVFETATEAKPAEMVTPVETLTPIDPVSPAEPTANDPQQTVPVTQPDLQTVDPVTPYPQSPVTASVEADSQSGRSGTIETVSESSIGIGFILSLIWIAGLAGMLIYVLIHYLLLRKKMADSVPYLQGIRQSEKVRSPFVLGLFRPVIYLPFGLDKQTESHVLAHERAHISRGDHWFKFLWFAVLAVHWFNPLAWLAFILLCGDIEYACDERVLSTMEEPDKKAYAESLLGLGISSRQVSACPVAFGETNVKNRIRRVFDFKKPAAWILALILFSCILLTACFSTVSVSPVPGEESRSEPVSDSEPSDDPGSAVDAPSDSSPGELSQIPADPSENGQPAMTREYRMVSYTDLNADVTETYSYDKYGQLVKTVRSDGSETVYTYTDDGHPLTEVHTSGGQTAMSVTWLYDPDGRLTEKKDSFGSSIRYEYDENGRLAKQIQSVSEQTYAYDENGNYAVTTVLGDGKKHVTHFNVVGKPVRTTVDGRVTNEYDYDEFGDLNESRSYDDSGKVFEYIRYHYAVDGSLIKKEISTEPGEVHYLRYDRTLVGESLDYECRITYVSKDGKEKPFGASRLSPMKVQKDGSRFDNRAFLPPEQKRLVGAFETSSATSIDEPIFQDEASQSYSFEDVSVVSIDEPVSHGDDDQSQSGELPETGFVITYYHDMAYNTVAQKTVADCDLAYEILDSLRSLQEAGETAPRLGEDIVVDSNTHDLLPVDNGTMWLECGSIGLFRLSGINDICKVQTHLGEGKKLVMTDSLKTLLHNAWYYYPYDCWTGTYKEDTLSLDHVSPSDSVVDSVRIESITPGKPGKWEEGSCISFYLLANEDREDESIFLDCKQSNDNLGLGDYKTIQLKKGQETRVELSFSGFNYGFEISIYIDQTRVTIWIYP